MYGAKHWQVLKLSPYDYDDLWPYYFGYTRDLCFRAICHYLSNNRIRITKLVE